jgi:hypothetical protein
MVRRIAVVLGLLVGFVAGGVSCDAPTFFCVDQNIGVIEEGCYCKDTARTACADWGSCISGCPL